MKGLKWIPDSVLRLLIKRRCANRLKLERGRFSDAYYDDYVAHLAQSPITIETDAANSQHYEVPAQFFKAVLGPHQKYSCGYWGDTTETLDQAAAAMLALTCERAQLRDNQTILEIGCGWGSLTIWMAIHYPHAQIVGVSNSRTQKAFILDRANQLGLTNVTIITADLATLDLQQSFDRIVSVEMFEHVRNYQLAFKKIAGWLAPDGLFFMHVFGHHTYPYLFNGNDRTSWTARYFFSGGQMPSRSLFSRFSDDLEILESWIFSGIHYKKTAAAWRANMQTNANAILAIFKSEYGQKMQDMWQAWRLFFLITEVLFGYNNGNDWQVYHYVMRRTHR